MRSGQWQLQDAKAQFSRLIDAALRGEPQHVTRRGRNAVVVLSAEAFEAFEALQRSANAEAPSFIAHLLARPNVKAKGDISFERAPLKLREIDLK